LAALFGSPVAFRKQKQRLISWTLLFAIVVLVLGVPVPSLPVSKSADEPFPCQHCACNCHSAAACWDKCCCHTDSEKLAWANRNGVQPPAFLVARVAKATQLATFADDYPSVESVTLMKEPASKRPACCAHRQPVAKEDSARAITTTKPAEESLSTVDVKKVPVPQGKRVLLWDAIAKCKGIELAAKLLSNTILPRGRELACAEPLLLFVSPLLNERILTRCLPVEPPVP
jgi:hypothetical protein